VRFSQFADNNPGHLACVDLFEKLIRLENEGQQDGEDTGDEESGEEETTDSDEEAEETDSSRDESDGEDDENGDSEPSEVTWNDIVAYADKGVGVLFAEWNETQKFDLQQYFSSVEHDVEDRLKIFEDLLTERPTTGSQGGVSF
jgi:cobalamin biosynthesis protein CobT